MITGPPTLHEETKSMRLLCGLCKQALPLYGAIESPVDKRFVMWICRSCWNKQKKEEKDNG